MMTPGPIGRNFGKQEDITPGLRSHAAFLLRKHFGEAPFTLTRRDLPTLWLLKDGADCYVGTERNMWHLIIIRLEADDAVTITMEY